MEITFHLAIIVFITVVLNVNKVSAKLDTNVGQTSDKFGSIELLSKSSDIKSKQTEGHKGIHLIAWDWDKNKNNWLFCLFLLIAAVTKIAYHFSHFLSNIIPESCILILLGLTIGAAIHYMKLEEEVPHFTTDLFFFILLPPIILESAYSLHDIAFLSNLGSILVFAVIGTFINIALIGPSLYLIELIPMKWLAFPNISFLELMVFGAAISAVDPVSVLAIFQDLSVNKSLYFLVFGESLLNDAVVIVVHRILLSMLDSEVQAIEFLKGFVSLFLVSGGGFLIGVIFGIFTTLLTLKTTHVRVIEPMVVITMAYMGFLSAEIVHFSGLISLIGCGLVQCEYTFRNISQTSRTTVTYFAKTLSTISDLLIFFFLGTMLFNEPHDWNTSFALFSLLFCLIYRFISVFVLTFILNNFLQRVPVIKFEEQILMAYGGLRGAVAFALIAILYKDPGIKYFGLLRTTTLFIILFTVFILGSTTKPLLKYLRIRREVKEEAKLFHLINSKFIEDLVYGISDITGVHTFNHFWTQKLIKLNEKYLKKYLTRGNNEDTIENILQRVIFEEEMEKMFGVNIDPEKNVEEIDPNKEDTNNNELSKRISISNNSRVNIETSDEDSGDEQVARRRIADKSNKSFFDRMSEWKIFRFLKKNPESEVEILRQERAKTRKMSRILEKAFDENSINQTILRNSVTKNQIINRQKSRITNDRRISRTSISSESHKSIPVNTIKLNGHIVHQTSIQTNDRILRRLSQISNISDLNEPNVKIFKNKF